MVAQKITIEPVTRIEGHAKVTIRMNDAVGVVRFLPDIVLTHCTKEVGGWFQGILLKLL